MKLHLITVGSPKLPYAKLGWDEYLGRLQRFHSVHVTQIADKHDDAEHLLAASKGSYRVGLVIDGREFSSPELASFLEKRAFESREVSFLIGGPDGLPREVQDALDYRWSFGQLTYPHDLAMVMLVESLYRAASITANLPYHH